MSFILDALRKSENERRKTEVPGIGDVPLVVHRNRVPRWTFGIIAGLSACLALLVWVWLRDAVPGAPPVGDGVVEGTTDIAPSTTAGAPSAPRGGEVRDLSTEARRAVDPPATAGVGNAPRTAVNSAPGGAADVPAPVSPAAVSPANAGTAAVPTLTLAQYRAAGGALPDLNLELHVYSPTAAERFVFINSAKYVEGQMLAEGPRLGAIIEEGAVLDYQGQSLLLPRE